MRYRLLFADAQGVVYDHPRLLAAVRSGDTVRPAAAGERAAPLPPGASLCLLPGRRPVGVDPATGEVVALSEVKVGRRTFVPHAVGATLPPGWTRALLPAAARPPLPTAEAPILPQWAYTAAALGARGPVVFALHTDRRRHWSPATHSTPDLARRVEARLAGSGNPIWRQIARCALEWRCFTAQNTFYGRDEGAIPSSAACNAACVGCLSEQEEGLPPSSHERIARSPTAEEMAEVAAEHLASARGRPMVSFGQGCEGEPLLRWKEIARAIRLVRARTARGSIHLNTNGSLTRGLEALLDAGLDACRISLNSASPSLYASYYRPDGYALADVVRSMELAVARGAYLSLNLLTFPGVTDRAEEAERLWRLVARVRPHQVQTRSLAIDPDLYLALARGRGGGGAPIGMQALLEGLRRARPGLVIGNFSRAKRERATPAPRRGGRGARVNA
ncbi:radical SAM protein [Anaeromyxobacter diazotrophicus]|uniref:Radical SAM protein n=1 Tax=Anaeromyxobacter diazotrophicus TaxID=2590199 RepID=A0A7I9VSM1_9BACT|nr:radical SAM protein [Anaeromyxobacter diazotrophicus]GEJ59301.1 radical SAM protein [Anaeromyxobacter diazotrophicus]